ncbi:TPA: ATP-dependent DNA helicase [Corynebacterium striatum]|uniref:ATP-dependent DNA helicase n=1 Tax=Corynebacterium striatum TaxID=43770 RepID=UPI00066824E7|nr:ATP-dependent DNA helicase [Corynebacterium striatum]CQD05577.1 putative ATP-dependent helicase DinG homolog [Corynebacterium striatum]HAT1137099.1 ATP-dependent DNA helicase [Corynebacterium striatum]HAT1145214.1 ATP-dependent DNA helicase [Corynebacterium striatum]HAT1169027.1 ATP-dependent DNA helicase [Corynebacterium striatum]HAT1174046.1 ATP-dependent DNA helicase [Corynebacterium striatum]
MSDEPLNQSTETLLDAAVESLGGARREGQLKMANAVTKALESERHLAVQAGTGTGKSLAYLVPAIRHAQNTGHTVIVSTATLALQRQLVERDLPRLVDALEPVMESKPTFAIMKGRSNYLCLNKVARADELAEEQGELLEEPEVSRLGRHIKRLYDWADETETGDRDDLDQGVPDLAWRQVSVTSAECLGATRCPHGEECFAELARRKAADVNVVVTNHALLAIDAVSDVNVLPEHEVVIVDEAHELDGRITSVSTAEITSRAIKMAANRAKSLGANGKDQRLAELADEFTILLSEFGPGRWTDMPDNAKSQLTALGDTLRECREAIARTPEGEQANDPEKFAERQNLANHLATMAEAVARILDVFATGDPSAHEDVVWLERDERSFTDTLAVAPLSIAGMLHEKLFGEQTVVLTSATLALGGRFDAMAAQWGMPKGTWDSLDVGYPFDPAKKGILYVAKHLPQPGRDGLAPETIEEMRELIMAAGGRTLGLFSSRRAAEQAALELKPKLPFDVFVQGEDSIGALVERFSKNENSCLFGTLTLWQGVDVPGPACSLVLIDRIPFPRPDNPLMQARTEAAQAAGRNGFMEVSATHAALLMAQGAGRLLRSVTDRGVVAVLDNRLETKRYGGFLKASMPQFWQTTDSTVVQGALQRLVTDR